MPGNLSLLEDAAAKLKDLTQEVVFVGGSTLELMLTDEAAGPVRGTIDVDVIAEITTYKDHDSFSQRLREHGFSEDSREHAPLCRWVHGDLTLDVMPIDEAVLGFSNIWYPGALYLARAVNDLLAEQRFLDALPGYFYGDEISQQRVPIVIDRLRKLSAGVSRKGAGRFAGGGSAA